MEKVTVHILARTTVQITPDHPGIGNTGEDSSSNTHSITLSSAPADPTTAGTGDTEGMQDIVAAEQVATAAGD